MATGYGTHSTTTYTADTDNMAITSSEWADKLLAERPDLPGYARSMWPGSGSYTRVTGDPLNQMNGLRLKGLTPDNTDAGKLYGSLTTAAGLKLYKASTKTGDDQVASWTSGEGFAAVNDSGIATHTDNAWTYPASITDDSAFTLRFDNFEIWADNIRSDVVDRIILDLLQHSQMPEMKAEYLKRLNDKTQLANAEIFCALWIFFRRQASGDPDDAKSVMCELYRGLYEDEMKKPIGWDTSVSVTEDDDDVEETPGMPIFGVAF